MTAQAVPTRTAVIVAVPDLEPVVERHRNRLDLAASWGVPAHVSVLYPFVPPEAVDADVLTRLGEVFASFDPFECQFSRAEWFGGDVLWLAPEPAQPFRELTYAVWKRFPLYPPYGGAFDEVVPHVTVGERRRGTLAELRAAEATVRTHLPITTRIERASLIAGSDAPDSWHSLREFSLGSRWPSRDER